MPQRPPSPELLDDVLEFFWLQSYAASSVTEVVACTPLNRHILYEHFGSKKALALATLEHYEARLDAELAGLPLSVPLAPERLAKAWQQPASGTCLERLRARGCFARQLCAEDRELSAPGRRPGTLATGLRRRLGQAAPGLAAPLVDALCAVLLADLEPGVVRDLPATLGGLLPSAREQFAANP